MRGAHALLHLLCVMLGIIPAYAGSTRRRYRKPRWSRKHPRVCGEHSPRHDMTFSPTGSSPRMRGARCSASRRTFAGGIIPAYAGSTPPHDIKTRSAKDHPRVCGEHFMMVKEWQPFAGSSPRMRGAQARIAHQHNLLGIIPAYAGSTSTIWPLSATPRDHPRVCGEHDGRGREFSQRKGSSPRMRGALEVVEVLPRLRGIIPAYAGSTKWVKRH